MRMMIKKLLKKYKYPPEGMEDAMETVMLQCELWTDNSDMEERMDSYAEAVSNSAESKTKDFSYKLNENPPLKVAEEHVYGNESEKENKPASEPEIKTEKRKTMKALSVHPDPAMDIAMGIKTIEYRSWDTHFRGELVICSTAKKQRGTVSSHALCIVDVVDVIKYGEKDYGWVLENPRMIKPVPVKGKLNLWNYEGPIEIIPDEEWCITEGESEELAEERWASFYEKYWAPIATK